MSEDNAKPKDDAKPMPSQESQEIEEVTSFHPLQLSGKDEENEQKMQELLRSMNEASSQLGGFMAEENKLVIELCASLVQVLKKLDVSFNIPPRDLQLRKKAKRVILTDEGHLELFYEKEEKHSAFLAEYPSEIVAAVLWDVIPELSKVMASDKKRISMRINFFEAMKKELGSIAKTIGDGTEGQPGSDRGQNPNQQRENADASKQG